MNNNLLVISLLSIFSISKIQSQVGIGISAPNITVEIDVNGQFKLGEKGSIQKNQISFNQYPTISISNLSVGATTTLNIPVPAGFEPSSTKATIIVTPAGDFLGTTFAMSNPRLSSTNNVVINLTNISSSPASLYSGHFYVTINEF